MERPGQIVCVGRNYREHAKEMGNEVPTEPLLFLKPRSCVVGAGAAIELPVGAGRVDFEGEVGVVIGSRLRKATAAACAAAVRGIIAANDVSAREWQKNDGQWARAKGFDTFCPLGPWIETELDPNDLAISVTVDGELRQSSRTSLMIFKIPEIIAFVTQVMTLLPGDVILTGTPAGIGPLAAGSTVEVSIEGIGTLTNKVSSKNV